MNLDKQQKTRLAIALGAVVVLVLGFAVLNKSDSDTSASANPAMAGPGAQNGQGPPGGPTGGGMGQGGPPGGAQGGPGQMEEVTGTAATKAKAAAEDEVDGGTAQRVMKNPQGSGYMVIVQTDSGTPTIVSVSTKFKVTDTQEMQGPPGGGQGGPPQDGQQQGSNTQ